MADRALKEAVHHWFVSRWVRADYTNVGSQLVAELEEIWRSIPTDLRDRDFVARHPLTPSSLFQELPRIPSDQSS